MAIDELQNKGDLSNWHRDQHTTPGFVPIQGVKGLADILGKGSNVGLVAALPPAARLVVGDRCVYEADPTNGVFWDLIYDGQGSYPWKVLGGSPLSDSASGNVSTASGSFVSLGSDDIQIAVPLAGDYRVSVGSQASFNTTLDAFAYMDYTATGHTAATADAATAYCANAAHGPIISTRSRPTVAAGMSAAGTITAKYAVSAGTGNFAGRWMDTMPVRVG